MKNQVQPHMILQGQSAIMDSKIHYDYTQEYEGIPNMLDQILDIEDKESQFVLHEVEEMWKDDGRDSFRISK